MTRIALIAACLLAIAAPAADAGRVPPGLPPAPTCTRPPLPGTASYARLCAAPATLPAGGNVLLTTSVVVDGATAANGTALFLYADGTLLASCYTYGGGCSFVVTDAAPAAVVFQTSSAGVASGGLPVTWT